MGEDFFSNIMAQLQGAYPQDGLGRQMAMGSMSTSSSSKTRTPVAGMANTGDTGSADQITPDDAGYGHSLGLNSAPNLFPTTDISGMTNALGRVEDQQRAMGQQAIDTNSALFRHAMVGTMGGLGSSLIKATTGLNSQFMNQQQSNVDRIVNQTVPQLAQARLQAFQAARMAPLQTAMQRSQMEAQYAQKDAHANADRKAKMINETSESMRARLTASSKAADQALDRVEFLMESNLAPEVIAEEINRTLPEGAEQVSATQVLERQTTSIQNSADERLEEALMSQQKRTNMMDDLQTAELDREYTALKIELDGFGTRIREATVESTAKTSTRDRIQAELDAEFAKYAPFFDPSKTEGRFGTAEAQFRDQNKERFAQIGQLNSEIDIANATASAERTALSSYNPRFRGGAGSGGSGGGGTGSGGGSGGGTGGGGTGTGGGGGTDDDDVAQPVRAPGAVRSKISNIDDFIDGRGDLSSLDMGDPDIFTWVEGKGDEPPPHPEFMPAGEEKTRAIAAVDRWEAATGLTHPVHVKGEEIKAEKRRLEALGIRTGESVEIRTTW